ncbi:MerR family transcriptional regulator [Chryseolinea sp. H1M3-3]|uniref:MerR family transcriptional regulator n=1 Tax=Chryseolinea sp. H1M3-3 TaxID=3034144 RepID=UPI0023ECA196|nr:MerR family transcriptional regulator [Chryseolinea sp. H1M3-3]
MGQYSIKELEQLSGIKAHTIRMWEKRHKIIEPSRTSTNIRYYSDLDLKKIINVSLLNTYGIKISKIADMSLDDMNKKVLELSELHNNKDIHIDQMVVAMIDMEEELFEKILNHLILRFGFEKTITEIVYPFLEKIGILWQTQNITPAHEHFISNLIRQKIIVAVDSLPLPSKTADKILIFLPEGELHELGLLFYHYLIRKAGFRTYYLGQNVPHEDLVSVYKVHQPVLMITSITSTPSIPLESIFERFENDFGQTKILVSGYQVQKFNGLVPHNVQIFSTALELNQYLP